MNNNNNNNNNKHKIILKWNKQELIFDLQSTKTLSELKSLIYEQTHILPDRQKLMGLKLKTSGVITNTTTIDELNLSSKIMLMGTPEESITELNLSKPVQPDLSEGQEEEQQDTTWIEDPDTIPLDKREEVRIKLERRINTYQGKILNEPRQGKKLLVLDIDYTLFDHRSAAETGAELMRPYLHEFLTTVYEHYDIGIWSATSMKWIESKMKLLGIEAISQGRTTNTTFNYKIIFYMDSGAMISIYTKEFGLQDVKPLPVIWEKYPTLYSEKNTIMFDDVSRNFLLNPLNGLKIRPFKRAHFTRTTDRELFNLTQYLMMIAQYDDLSKLDHRCWEQMVERQKFIERRKK
ncbi:unnamed protein product [Rotaria sordida]|uniref:Ubiquitin-like domain-containing CTD phosphatase 1 n=1 Tax=Rotaria sordida TaxID=392033 RepID=A0A814ZQ47_9BILA|nr:unnamed protein product [Rotaria sordida]CAF1244608.1 unnamed protein product [Rotaria sordida]